MRRLLPSLFLSWLLFPAMAACAWTDATSTELIRQWLAAERVPLGENHVVLRTAGLGRTFYQRNSWQAVWLDHGRVSPPLQDLVRALRGAADHGLEPSAYHLAAIDALSHRIAATAAATGEERLVLELLATDAFLLYAGHLVSGRVDPATLIAHWCIAGRRDDLVGALETAVQEQSPREVLRRLAPQHRDYARLQTALATYRAIASRGGWEPVDAGPALRQGSTGPRVAQLGARLRITGEYEGAPAPDTLRFDQALDDAVRRFQRRHGLDVDGVAGGATLRALNLPAARRIDQIVANLERWRWLPASLGERHAVVNIAAFSLEVVEKDQVVLAMKTVVGKEYQKTPVFSSRITHVVLDPYWNVPTSIATRELWPKFRADPDYAAQNQYEILPGGRIRQRPGPLNALGRVKFHIPNDFSVFLHDTPSTALFARSVRAFSHGCIRLEKPLELAEYLLGDDPRWNRSAIDAATGTGRERQIAVRQPLPVHILYWTAWAGRDGEIEFRHDLYGRDEPLLARLRS
jgi:L,D-transpeptidase YcbB